MNTSKVNLSSGSETKKVINLIKQGIIYEDDFVETYLKVLRDEGFMEYFGENNQEEANQLLTTMINESKAHKAVLDNLLNTIQ